MIEKEIFKKCKVIPQKCIQYGFEKKDHIYIYHKILKDSFEVVITISGDKVTGKIIDQETQEEYINYRIENQIGEFSTTIRSIYIDLLKDIKDKCCMQNNFVFPQANRISHWIKETFQDIPEYLWDDDKDAVFRNQKNKKWYGIIMYINKMKLDQEDKMVEVMNVKLPPDEIDMLVQKKGYYRAYHMNKKHWISFILDETIKDSEIKKLIDKSYQFTKQK